MGKPKILLVEDHEISRKTMARALAGIGYNVEPVASAEEALALPGLETFDLLISDVNLPGMSGLELCVKLRRKNPSLQAIATTALDAMDDRFRTQEAGFAEHLSKPLALRDLQGAISRLLGNVPRSSPRDKT